MVSKKQLAALLVCSLVTWTVGNGLAPLLPVYAMQLGAATAMTGYYLSFSYLALTLGTLTAGWLSDRIQRRKTLLILAAVAGIPLVWLMGQVTNVWHLALLTVAVWFMGGMQLALVGIMAGLLAGSDERGKVFGLLGLTGALGAVVAGTGTGLIADRWGYPTMFACLALFSSFIPLAALFLKDKVVVPATERDSATAEAKPRLGGAFVLLLLASLAAGLAYSVVILGRSLVMNGLGFSAAAIASTVAVSGVATMPLPAVIGRLSDRVDRKRLMALSYLLGSAGLFVLPLSAALWHFWVILPLIGVSSSVSGAVGAALVADLVPPKALGKGMSLFNATAWVGGIIGSALTGVAVQSFGATSTLLAAAFLPLFAILLLMLIQQAGETQEFVSRLKKALA
jgi:MFS family permease